MRVAASWISEAMLRTEQPAATDRSTAVSAGLLAAFATRSRASTVTRVSASGPAIEATMR